MKIPQNKIFKLMKTKAGAPPGTLINTFAQTSVHESTRLISVSDDSNQDIIIEDFEKLPSRLWPEATNWLIFTGLGDIDKLEHLGSVFQINPLIIEDILNAEHLPKAEETDEFLFFVIKILTRNTETDSFETNHVCFLLGKRFIITFLQRNTSLFDNFIKRIKTVKESPHHYTHDYILYQLIDIIVDHYYLLFNQTDEKLEEIEEILMSDQSADMTSMIQQQKRELNFIRRNILPVAEAVRILLKIENAFIKKHNRTFFNDIADHLQHLLSATDNYRETITSLYELQMMNYSNRMNNVMKSLTIIATIFIPLTLITGIYGMNFKYMPELTLRWSYPAVLIIIFAGGIAMYLFMRQKKWF